MPGWRAFLQEGAQAFLAFGTDADSGDGVFGVASQRRSQRAMTDFTQQVLAGAHGRWTVEQQVVDPLIDFLLQFSHRVALRQQADFPSPLPAETFCGQRIAACRALADGLHHERADDRRCQADAHFRQAELRVVGANRHVAATDQAQRAAERRALHHGQRRDFQFGEVVHQLRQFPGVIQVGVVIELGRLLHPGQISAGADLAWMQQSAELDYHTNLDDARELAELMYNLAKLKVPTLAVVQGAAFGGALGLISCCDMAIGADDAQFCLSEVRIGLAPAVISPFVVQAIGERAARRYALTAERFGGQRAREIGLLSESYPMAELEQKVDQWVDNLLLNSPAAMRASKDLLREVGHGALTPALRRYTENAIARIRVSPEGQEGLRAFLQKRSPTWQAETILKEPR